jgi:hypothetical protein
MARYARNTWIADTTHWWAFCSLNASPGARAYYDELRARGKSHTTALRQVGSRLVGIHARLPENRRLLRRAHRLGTPLRHNRASRRLIFLLPFPAPAARSRPTRRSAARVKAGRRPPAGLP